MKKEGFKKCFVKIKTDGQLVTGEIGKNLNGSQQNNTV